jgi:hypothetical protein
VVGPTSSVPPPDWGMKIDTPGGFQSAQSGPSAQPSRDRRPLLESQIRAPVPRLLLFGFRVADPGETGLGALRLMPDAGRVNAICLTVPCI